MIALRYATDENLKARIGPDFLALVPSDQKVASGTDGVFTTLDRWTLVSASTSFVNQGVAAGMVIHLSTDASTASPFGANGEAMAVDGCSSVTPNDVLLRRIAMEVGAGYPPGPAAGLTRVRFLIATLNPQIEEASYNLNNELGINTLTTVPVSFWDIREVRSVVVLRVAYQQYIVMARGMAASGQGASATDFFRKAADYKAELEETRARLVVHWGHISGTGGGPATPTRAPYTRFGMRISR